MKKYNLIIWDFNGTILDDTEHCIHCANKLLKAKNLKTIDSMDEYHKLFRFPIKDYYKAAGFDFETYPYETLAHEWMAEYLSKEAELKPVPGVVEVLDELEKKGYKQIVLSSCELTMLTRELKMLGLYDKFDAVLGLDNIYAGGKIEMALKWAGGKLDNAVVIGDTTHDYDTAVALGADAILYSGSHNSKEALSKFGAPVVEKIQDVLKYID